MGRYIHIFDIIIMSTSTQYIFKKYFIINKFDKIEIINNLEIFYLVS